MVIPDGPRLTFGAQYDRTLIEQATLVPPEDGWITQAKLRNCP